MTSISSSLPSIRHQTASPFSHSHLAGKIRPTTTGSHLQDLSIKISLAVLATGFNLLGLLALLHRGQEDSTGGPVLEGSYCVIGSLTSIFAGAIFMIAGWIYWSRSSSDPG
jgi:hypothetical protein